MLRTLTCTFPFMVCLCWFVTLALHRGSDSAKRVLTLFMGTCSVLYLCHAFYFTSGLPVWAESLWGLCSLSVYPLYFVYISHLTFRPLTMGQAALCLLPGFVVALAMLLFHNPQADMARKLLNAVQILGVLYFGYRRMKAFDREVANVYADTEGRNVSQMRNLLVAFVGISLLSAVANVLGKAYFASSDPLLLAVLFPFAVLLYLLGYIGYTRHFTLEQYSHDTIESKDRVQQAAEVDDGELGQKIEELMRNGYYLTQNLQINDLASQVGSCRTYVSNYINKTYGYSFSDYINHMRVEHAKQLLRDHADIKMTHVAEMSGFSSLPSFYRNFNKFAGTSPADWQNMPQEGLAQESLQPNV